MLPVWLVLACSTDGPLIADPAAASAGTGQRQLLASELACDGLDSDADGTTDEGCADCDFVQTRDVAWWSTATCVISGRATGSSLLPLEVTGRTLTTSTVVTNLLGLSSGGNLRLTLVQEVVALKLNTEAFLLHDRPAADVDGDGLVDTWSEVIPWAESQILSTSAPTLAAAITTIRGLNSSGEALGTWFDAACAGDPELCNTVDDDGDGATDEDCACVTIDGVADAISPEVGTVVEVTWNTNSPADTWVEYGPTTAYGERTPAAEGRALLLGNRADTDVHYKIVSDVGGTWVSTADRSVRTDPLPASLPTPTVTLYDPGAKAEGWIVTVVSSASGRNLVVFDEAGEIVWYRQMDSSANTNDVVPAPDGSGLWTMEYLINSTMDASRVFKFDWWGDEVASIDVSWAHHALTLLPDGALAVITLDTRIDATYGAVVGDRIVEVDVDTGTVTEVFSTWDYLPVEVSRSWTSTFFPGGYNWTHANGVSYDPATDSYWFSLYSIDRVLQVDRATGSVLTDVGGLDATASDFSTFVPAESEFRAQHAASMNADGNLMLFSYTTGLLGNSWASEYELDAVGGTVTEVWTYGRGTGLKASSQGDVRALPNGNRLANFGSGGVLAEIDASGVEVLELVWSSGTALGQSAFVTDLYAPESGP